MPVAEDKCDKEHGAGMRREKKTNWTQGGVGKREKVIRSGRMMEGDGRGGKVLYSSRMISQR